jgi:predicted dithiol-disulfide oxidoreductase (DUF899 family)
MAAVNGLRAQIETLRGSLREAIRAVPPDPVHDYEFQSAGGPVKLSELFGDKDDLFVIHNMGRGCRYCTLWADGFNGVYEHLADRAGFVLSTPDPVEVQQQFAASRGWRFPMVSHAGTSFAEDMGYYLESGFWPGISAFRRRDGRIERVSDAPLGPGDDFCTVWHILDLLPEGAAGWEPKYSYA